MTVSLHLTAWALPSLLAVLVVARDLAYLWPRRRERAVPTFLLLSGASGLWALLQGVALVSVSDEVRMGVRQAASVPAAVAALALALFCLVFIRRWDLKWSWPLWLLYLASSGTVVLTFVEVGGPWLASFTRMVPDGTGRMRPPLPTTAANGGFPWAERKSRADWRRSSN